MGPVSGPAVSGAPKAFGVLSLVFASLILMLALPGTCGSLAGASMAEAMVGINFELDSEDAPIGLVAEAAEALSDVYLGFGLIGLMLIGMSGWLIGVGVGQLKYRPWAQKQSIWWGTLGIGSVVLMVLIMFLLVGPAYGDFFRILADQTSELQAAGELTGEGFDRAIGFGGGIIHVIVFLPYPLIMLILFRSEKIKRAMSGLDEDLSRRASAFD